MAGQLSAVTGRRIRPGYTADINARARNLPSLYALKDRTKYDEANLQLAKDRLATDTQTARDALEYRKKQDEKTNALGLINLGVTTGLSARKNRILADQINAEAPIGSKSVPGVGLAIPGASQPGSWKSFLSTGEGGITDAGGWKESLKSGWKGIAGSALTGAAAGSTVGKLIPFGGKTEKAAIGGALVGGTTSALSGGNAYQVVGSAALGAIGAGSVAKWLG